MNFSQDTSIRLAAVIVFYQPDKKAVDNLITIAGQMDFVVVVCNSPFDSDQFDLGDNANITFVQNSTNKGLGQALNFGVTRAFSEGYFLCCTFDQDTVIFSNFRKHLVGSYLLLRSKCRVGIVAPGYQNDGSSVDPYCNEQPITLVHAAVQSGCLFTKECIEHCGEFREDFFIESIDTEYCLRARKFGFKVAQISVPLMEHGAGEKLIRNLFGREVVVTSHSVGRIFLQYRNYAFVFRKYWLTDPRWAVTSLLSMIKKYILICIFESDSLSKGRYILNGVLIGLRSKNGFAHVEVDL